MAKTIIDIPGGRGKQFPVSRLRSGLVFAIALVILGIVFVFTSVYMIPAESAGVVTRFGKYITTTEPGLHFKIPFGVDRVETVPVLRQEKQEFGYRTLERNDEARYVDYAKEPRLLRESLMITGDRNAALVEWSVQYRIPDPQAYLFNVRSPEATLRNAAESVMRQVVGDRTVDEVITVGRQEIEVAALQSLQGLMDKYTMGIRIDQVVLQDVNPPDRVQPSFNQVNQAQQELERRINEGKAEYNRAIPRAKGEALQRIQEAEGYAMERVNEAEGDAAKFNAMLTEYLKAPEPTRSRMYLESMQKILPKMGRKVLVDKDVQQVLPLLNLDGGAALPAAVSGGTR